jgi:transposase
MDPNDKIIAKIREKFEVLKPHLNERTKRMWVASEAMGLGRGAYAIVAKATGMSRTTIYRGVSELKQLSDSLVDDRVRNEGGGRKKLTERSPEIIIELQKLVEDTTCGDPESPLLWTCKSTRQLSEALTSRGLKIGRQKVSELLDDLGYSLQGNRKTEEGSEHPDRDWQFRYINRRVKLFQRYDQPVISVDTKKKELIGNFSNKGQEWRKKGEPRKTNTHDFGTDRISPYGVYDQTYNQGWVNVGTDHDTSEFAVESIRKWWEKMGAFRYPEAGHLLITADCGGSNGYRVRLWKTSLQRLANETGLVISVCHFPPGTSKWNKIEHRMFCHISMNWRGRPLTGYDVVVNLIGNTTTREGLTIEAEIDENKYEKGKKISDEEFTKVQIKRANFRGEWNYKILPKCPS